MVHTTWPALLTLAMMAPASATAAATKPAITTLMYLVNRPDSIASFRAHAAKISIIAPQTFSMDAQGFVAGEVPPEVMRIAAEKHVAVTPLVTNRGFNQPLMHTVLDTPEARARAAKLKTAAVVPVPSPMFGGWAGCGKSFCAL
jgi:hypothetical protein